MSGVPFELAARNCGCPQPAAGPWQISDQCAKAWPFAADGKELYYFGADRSVMGGRGWPGLPAFQIRKTEPAFRPSEANPVAPESASISRGRERIVIGGPYLTSLRQLTVFDREGKVVGHHRRQPGF